MDGNGRERGQGGNNGSGVIGSLFSTTATITGISTEYFEKHQGSFSAIHPLIYRVPDTVKVVFLPLQQAVGSVHVGKKYGMQ